MKINIIIDNPNNWFARKKDNLIKSLQKNGHDCFFYNDHKLIQKNSDISFFLGCEKIIAKNIRIKSKYNIVIHASDLPKGKGMSPTTWQILENKKRIPVTLFEVADGFDTGDYYLKDSFLLDGDELINEWQEKLYKCMKKMILKFVKIHDQLRPTKQIGKSTFYKRRNKNDSELNINKSIKSQFNLLRVVDNNNYPAYFHYKNNKYVIKIYKEK